MKNKKYIKHTLLFALLPQLVCSSSQTVDAISYSNMTATTSGEIQSAAKVLKIERDKKSSEIKNTFKDSVAFSDFEKQETKPYLGGASSHEQEMKSKNVDARVAMVANFLQSQKEEEAKRLKAIKDAKNEKPSYYVGGYCTLQTERDNKGIPKNLEISRSSEFANLSCLFDFGEGQYRKSSLMVSIYPDYQRLSLIGIPVMATFDNQVKAEFNGIVFNSTRSSFNLADKDKTDAKRIHQLLAKNALIISSTALDYTKRYMSALSASRVSQKINYVNSVDSKGISYTVPIASNSVAKPIASEALIAAGIDIFAKTIFATSEDYLYDLRPLFAIGAGKRFYVEGTVSFGGKGVAQAYGKINKNEYEAIQRNNSQWRKRNDGIIKTFTPSVAPLPTSVVSPTRSNSAVSTFLRGR